MTYQYSVRYGCTAAMNELFAVFRTTPALEDQIFNKRGEYSQKLRQQGELRIDAACELGVPVY